MAACPPFVALIPARMASSRLPGKPLLEIAGLPMVVHVARRAARSGARQVVVATDDARIAETVRGHGFEAVLTRPDHPTGTDRLSEAATLLQLPDDLVVVNVQGDEPLIEPDLIDDMARLLSAHPECAIATAAHAIDTLADYLNPNVVKVLTDAAGHAVAFSRAPVPFDRELLRGFPGELPQDLSETLKAHPPLRHVGLYAYRVAFLRDYPALTPCPLEQLEALEQWRALWHGYRIALTRLPGAPSAGVDTPEDLERVRALLR